MFLALRFNYFSQTMAPESRRDGALFSRSCSAESVSGAPSAHFGTLVGPCWSFGYPFGLHLLWVCNICSLSAPECAKAPADNSDTSTAWNVPRRSSLWWNYSGTLPAATYICISYPHLQGDINLQNLFVKASKHVLFFRRSVFGRFAASGGTLTFKIIRI